MAIVFQRASQVVGTSVSIDIGAAGNDRLVCAIMDDGSTSGATFQGTVTVDGKTFTQSVVGDSNVGLGNHIELHTIDEATLGSSNGTLTVSYSGGDAAWGIAVLVFYGVDDDTLYDSGSASVGALTDISITGIDSPDNGLVVMAAGNGSTVTYSGWTSPLTERTEGTTPDGPNGASQGSASGIETTGQTNKTYTVTASIGNTRMAALVAVFSEAVAAPVVTNVTSDAVNGTYVEDDTIYIQVCFDEAIVVSGMPELFLDVITGGRATIYTPNWTPAVLDAEGWYDASDTGTITDTTGSVSQWDDKSPNSLDLTQGTASIQPTTGSVTINGLNALNFAADKMTTSSNPFGASISNAAVFCVFRTPATLVNGTHWSLTGIGTSANRWQSHMPYGNATVYFDCGGTSGANRLLLTSWAAASQTIFASFYCSTTDSLQQIWKNGVLSIGDATGHTVSTIGNISVGSDGGTTYGNMDLGEFIIINGTVSTEIRQNIEGYLAWKWGQTANLPSGHPYEDRPPLTWCPCHLNLDVWYDAADEATITDTAGAVDQWNDKSGYGRHLKQTSTNRPTTGSTVDGKNAIDFVAANSNYMDTDDAATWLNGTEHTVFAVSSQEIAGGAYYICGSVHTSGADDGLHIGWRDANNWTMAHYSDDTDYAETQDTAVGLTCTKYNSPGSEFWRNGSGVGANLTLPANDLNTSGVFQVGTGFRNAGEFMDGKFCELIVLTGTLTEADRQKIEGYLAWKWGLEGGLPVTHPYKQFAPAI